jgi:hypothetical protein
MDSQYQDHARLRARRDGSYGASPPLERLPRRGPRTPETSYAVVVMILPYWSRPYGFRVCSMFARMSRYGPVAAGTRRHRILRGAAHSGTSWCVPALAGTG